MTNHTMPVLTEEKRLELITDCKAEIEYWQKLSEFHESRLQWDDLEIAQSKLQRQQIALASLEAEPSAYITIQGGCRAPDDCEFYHELSEKDDLSCNGTPAFPVYAATPVPALKLPDIEVFNAYLKSRGMSAMRRDGEHVESASRFSLSVWNACLAETKRLNGVTE